MADLIKHTVNPAVVLFDYIDLQKMLDTELSKYKGLVVTADSYQQCKAKQKELAGYKTQIETLRKKIKAEILAPYEEVERRCKELVASIEEVERPIKEGVLYYDDMRKQEKIIVARNLIEQTVAEVGLSPEFAARLTSLPEYSNLTASEKDVKTSLQQRALTLKIEQNNLEESIKTLELKARELTYEHKVIVSPEPYVEMLKRDVPLSEIMRLMSASLQKSSEPPKPVAPTPPVDVDEPEFVVAFECRGTVQELKVINDFIRNSGIKYDITKNEEV